MLKKIIEYLSLLEIIPKHLLKIQNTYPPTLFPVKYTKDRMEITKVKQFRQKQSPGQISGVAPHYGDSKQRTWYKVMDFSLNKLHMILWD